MTEQQLQELGFERNEVGQDITIGDSFHYYTLKIGDIMLISSDSLESKERWAVYIFDFVSFELTDFDTVRQFIDIIKSNQNGK